MSLLGTFEAIQWAILVLGGIVAVLIGRRSGKLAIVGVFLAAWAGVVLVELARGPSIIADWEFGLSMAAILVSAAMIPMLFVIGRVSIFGGIAWAVVCATFAVPGLTILMLLWVSYVPIGQTSCHLPTLEASVPGRTLAEIGNTGLFTARCPVPLATAWEFDRDYGVIGMGWGTLRHELHVFARTADGQPLGIGSDRVQTVDSWPWPPRPGYTDVVPLGRFSYQGVAPGPNRPVESEAFSLTVSDTDGAVLEELDFSYASQECTCAVYMGLWHPYFKVP